MKPILPAPGLAAASAQAADRNAFVAVGGLGVTGVGGPDGHRWFVDSR